MESGVRQCDSEEPSQQPQPPQQRHFLTFSHSQFLQAVSSGVARRTTGANTPSLGYKQITSPLNPQATVFLPSTNGDIDAVKPICSNPCAPAFSSPPTRSSPRAPARISGFITSTSAEQIPSCHHHARMSQSSEAALVSALQWSQPMGQDFITAKKEASQRTTQDAAFGEALAARAKSKPKSAAQGKRRSASSLRLRRLSSRSIRDWEAQSGCSSSDISPTASQNPDADYSEGQRRPSIYGDARHHSATMPETVRPDCACSPVDTADANRS